MGALEKHWSIQLSHMASLGYWARREEGEGKGTGKSKQGSEVRMERLTTVN